MNKLALIIIKTQIKLIITGWQKDRHLPFACLLSWSKGVK